jgi:uncharacterized protein
MPNIDASTPGHFCWIELATSDPVAAKKFYSDVFGWTTVENDMGGMGIYYLFQKNGRDCAAMYQLMPDQAAQGVPPNWTTYVATSNADQTAEKAKSLGATILAGPFDVQDHGRMAMLQDPQGAVFAIWQSKEHHGVEIRDEADTLCWNELASKDMEGSKAFYTQLMGWDAKGGSDYTEWHVAGKGIGGMRSLNEGEPTPPNWMPYFMAESCDATTAKVQAAGGRVYMEPRDMEGVGRFSVVADPQGAVFALFQ